MQEEAGLILRDHFMLFLLLLCLIGRYGAAFFFGQGALLQIFSDFLDSKSSTTNNLTITVLQMKVIQSSANKMSKFQEALIKTIRFYCPIHECFIVTNSVFRDKRLRDISIGLLLKISNFKFLVVD